MPIRMERKGAVAVMTIDRRDALNALNAALIAEIGAAIDQAANSTARALVFVGAGPKAFSAGADIREISGRTVEAQRQAAIFGQMTFAKLDRLRLPSIAVVHGFALGGGLELAMACTFRVATPRARMGLPEIKLGLIPAYGGTQRLPRLVGPARATELILSGRMIDAAEAERIGLVNAIVEGEDPVAIGCDFAGRFIDLSLDACFSARQAVEAASATSFQDGLRIEADLLAEIFAGPDAQEGIAAFNEKQPPRFNRPPQSALAKV